MSARRTSSAGLLLYRRRDGRVEVFLAHPGGPFWRSKDRGAWTLPKGEVGEGEDPLLAARREFEEETGIRPEGPFLELGSVRQKGGKQVTGWAWEGDADPERIVSNEVTMELPRGSGRFVVFPEVDRCAWFGLDEARARINPAQAELIDRLERALASGA